MPYYNKTDFKYVLMSLYCNYKGRNDYEVVIIEDSKNTNGSHDSLMEAINEYKDKVNIKHLRVENEGYMAVKLRNYGASQSNGDIIVLTGPDCMHFNSILNGLDEEYRNNDDKYVVCACRNVSLGGDKLAFDDFKYTEKEWYQHSVEMNRNYHFCNAIFKSRYIELGGFDEEYNKGLWYDDDDFLNTVKKSGIPIIPRDDLITLHIDHDRSYQVGRNELRNINRLYYNKKWNKNVSRPPDD